MSIKLYPDYIEDLEEYLASTNKPTLKGFVDWAKKNYDAHREEMYHYYAERRKQRKWWHFWKGSI